MAIMIAMVKFRQVADAHPNKYNSLAIFSDSQAALNLLAQPLDMKTLQYLARFLLRTWKPLQNRFEVRLYWTPGREDIDLNEKADKAAKQAAEKYEDPMILPTSLGCLLKSTQEKIRYREAVSTPPYKTKKMDHWRSDLFRNRPSGGYIPINMWSLSIEEVPASNRGGGKQQVRHVSSKGDTSSFPCLLQKVQGTTSRIPKADQGRKHTCRLQISIKTSRHAQSLPLSGEIHSGYGKISIPENLNLNNHTQSWSEFLSISGFLFFLSLFPFLSIC